MNRVLKIVCLPILALGFFSYQPLNGKSEKQPTTAASPATVTVASYNIENWGKTDRFIGDKKVEAMKPDEEKKAVASIIKKINPDILGLMEVLRDTNDVNIKSVRESLKEVGLNYPYMATVTGEDERAQNVLLSRFPIISTKELNEDAFSLNVRQQIEGKWQIGKVTNRVERGFIDAVIKVNSSYQLEVMVAHLKSKRPIRGLNDPTTKEFGEDAIRRNEALILRGHMMQRYQENPEVNLIVMGDLNDLPTSPAIRTLIGQKSDEVLTHHLVLKDYLGDQWTHFHFPEKAYNLIDYMLVSEGLIKEFVPEKSYIYREKAEDSSYVAWASASDHRAIVSTFWTTNLSLVKPPETKVKVVHQASR